ncbi:MAG TPA: HPr family phosphocarrier protein [Pyrinomonadaceae bacterium]|nr:HPr family phosphocarrier protein [Pyrinomonadaceae bacterium]HMP66652.1 HPr family phosphocarrier protein [Pyrinomonadaceae bacterium]
MIEGRVTVSNTLGLHARAAAQLVKTAAEFTSKIVLERSDGKGSADAKSILGVLTLSARYGTELIVRVEGEDEVRALAGIIELFGRGFGEN